jgi:hypothetical protein
MERGAPAPPVTDTGRRSKARQRRAFRSWTARLVSIESNPLVVKNIRLRQRIYIEATEVQDVMRRYTGGQPPPDSSPFYFAH